MDSERTRNLIEVRLLGAKRAALDVEMGKGAGWAQKIVEGKSGVTIEDMPAFLSALGLRVVDANHVPVDRSVLEAYEVIIAAAARNLPALRGGA
jgi:hypothetical protein